MYLWLVVGLVGCFWWVCGVYTLDLAVGGVLWRLAVLRCAVASVGLTAGCLWVLDLCSVDVSFPGCCVCSGVFWLVALQWLFAGVFC